ncbi:carboxypeptidase regulatory-like domain-containing protein [Chloroflexota bacterium]
MNPTEIIGEQPGVMFRSGPLVPAPGNIVSAQPADTISPEPVTNVVLVDNDATAVDVNGLDVTVTWTPSTTADATFNKYVIYLLPEAIALDIVGHAPFAEVSGGQTTSSLTASTSETLDSTGTVLADGAYKAYVVAVDAASNKSAEAASAAATLTTEVSAQPADTISPEPVTNVVLADNDAMAAGINGLDVTVTWTPVTTADGTFSKYVIYLLPEATALDVAGHAPFAEVTGDQSISSLTASTSETLDSTGTVLANGAYKAYVVAVDAASNKSAEAASAAATLTTEVSAQPADTISPEPLINIVLPNSIDSSSHITGTRPDRMVGPGRRFKGAGIDVAGDAGETLVSVKVNILIPSGSPFDPETGLASLSATDDRAGITIYKDNKSAGSFGQPDPPEDFKDSYLPLVSTPTWAQNGSIYETTLTLVTPDAVPADNIGNNYDQDYFVMINTSDAPPPGATFRVQIPANGVTLSSGTFPITARPESPNVITIGQGGMMGSPLVISEIQTAGAVANDEFIELYNRAPVPVDLSTWSIQYKGGEADALSSGSPAKILNLSGSIPGNGFFLIANSDGYDYGGTKVADVTYTDSNFALGGVGGTVFLVNAQVPVAEPNHYTVQDRVAWGSGNLTAEGTPAPAPASNGSIERKASPDSSSSSMTTGTEVGMGNSFDSENNNSDFIVRNTAEPQNSSDTESTEMSGSNPVVINEVYYNNTSSGSQWIEFYNNSPGTEDVSGWKVLAAGKMYTIPASTSISASGYLVIHWNADGTNDSGNLYTGVAGWASMPTLAGDVFLTDGGDGAKDYVEYGAGGQTSESAAGGSQWPAGDYVSTVLQGQSSGRGNNGYDTNKSSDWQTFSTPTIGQMNAGGDSFSPDPVTNVVLVDNDITNFGLNGEDVTVTWTPATTPDTTFDKYVIYILPAATELDRAIHHSFAQVYGGQSIASFTGSPSKIKDSADNDLADGSYKAYVRTVDMALNRSSAVASAPATLTGETSAESGADNSPPMIMSMPVTTTKVGTNVSIKAQVHDDRELDGTTPIQLKWRVSGSVSFNAISGTEASVDMGVFQHTLPWDAGWSTSTQIEYYLVAKDAADNYSYFTTSPAFDSDPNSHDAADETMAATYYFTLSFADAADYSRTISGTVYDSTGAPLNGTTVMIPGSGIDAINTGAGGTYSFTVADGNYGMMAVKEGFMESWIDGIFVNASNPASTGNDFYLSEGHSGIGGDATRAYVMWTDPGDGMNGAPTDISMGSAPIVAHISEPMDSSTIVDTNATDADSNVFLTTTGEDRVAGRVTYDENTPGDVKIIFSSTTSLNKGATYYFVITPAVTDLAGNSIEGNQPDGRYTMEFRTFTDTTGGTFGEGSSYPPYVVGSMPTPGSFNIPTNTKLSVKFSEPMDSSTIDATNSAGLNVKLYDSDYQGTSAGEYVTLASVTLDNANKQYVTLTVGGGGTLAANHRYEIRVLGGARSTKGIYVADPGQSGYESQIMYRAEFDTSSGIDSSGAPEIKGTNLEMYRTSASGSISVAGNLIDAPVNMGVIEIGFGKDIDPTTVTRSTITLKVGTTLIKGSVHYRTLDRVATFSPSLALNPNTTYTLKVLGGSSGVADVIGGAGHYLASDYYAVFTTSSETDTQKPAVSFARATGTNNRIAITFSEPMNRAKMTNTNLWPSSVLNMANYTLYTDVGPPEQDPTGTPFTANGGTTGVLSEAEGLNSWYVGDKDMVEIEGLQIPSSGGFRVWVNNVTDLSGNVIEGNIAAPDTSAFGRNATGAPFDTGSGGPIVIDMGDHGMNRTSVFPKSMIAGATNTWVVDLSLSRALPQEGEIVLTFPSGFDISGAKDADPNRQWGHKDINGPGPGVVVLGTASESPQSGGANNDGVTVNASARTITITLGAVGTAGYLTTSDTNDDRDFLHIKIDGIKNSNIPKSFETSGYTVEIKTMTGGSLLESINSMPFFITEAGQYAISGTVTFPNNITTSAGDPVDVFGGSPMVGPMEAEVTFSNESSANYTITGLPAGEYHLMTEPMVVISSGVGDGEYFGSGIPEPIWIDDTTTTSGVFTQNFTFTSSAGKPSLSVNIIGDFSGSNAGEIDIFAGSPSGFAAKTVSLNAIYSSGTPFNTTLYLPANGTYMVGMGPAMPKGPVTMGPPPMPAWAPPPSIAVSYNGSAWAESSDTSNDGIVNFTIGTSLSVSGHVYDGSGNPIPNAEIYAYSPMGMFGTHTTSLQDGSFTLNLPEGMYKVGAFVPGMPTSREFGVDVKSIGGETKVYVDGVSTADVIIKIAKPDRTISGKVTDGTNTISGASVYAYRTDGPGHAEATTDNSGVYILYVTPGTWNLGAYLPGFGPQPEKTGITVTTADKADINFFPEASATYVKISGNVSIGGTPQTFMPIRAVEIATNGSRTSFGNGASTDSSGNYSIKAKGTTSEVKHYRVDIWTPEYGEIAANNGSGVTNTPTPDQPWNVAVTTSDVANVNVAVDSTDLKNLTLSFTNGTATMTAYIGLEKIDPTTKEPLGMGRHVEVKDLTGPTIVSVPAGSYFAYTHIPGYGEFTPTETQTSPYYLDLTSDTTATFDLSGVGGATVTGTVKDGEGTPINDAFVHIGNPETGIHFGTPTDSSGNYSLSLKPGTYRTGAEKPGYVSQPTTIIVASGSNTKNLTITKTSLTISGYVYVDTNTNGSYDTGEGLPASFVHAEQLGGGFAGTPADPDGAYTLYVSPGDWRLFGAADGYQKKEYTGNPVAVSSAAVNGVNILLSTTMSLTAPKAEPFKPASGTTFDDQNAGLKITVPPNAVGSEATDFQIQTKETSNLPSSLTSTPLGGKGKRVVFVDASGNPVTTLDNEITIEMTYTKADLVAGGIASLEGVGKIKLAYWDDSTGSYVMIPTTIAYDPASQTSWANLVGVTFKAMTNHLTVFTPIVSSDGLAPAAPTTLAGTASVGSVALTWTVPTTNSDSSTLSDLLGYEIYRSTSSTGTYAQVNTADVLTNSYSDTTVIAGTTYYYNVTATDTGGNESVKSSASTGILALAAAGGGGGGGGGGGLPAAPTVSVSLKIISDRINSRSKITADVTAASLDGKVEISIDQGTTAKTRDDYPIVAITIAELVEPPPPPEDSSVIGLTYDLGPDGATFDPPITLTFTYDLDSVPEGVAEENLSIAIWDEDASKWTILEGATVNSVAHTITAPVSHFSLFTILTAQVAPSVTSPTALVLAPTTAPVAAPAPTPAPAPAPAPLELPDASQSTPEETTGWWGKLIENIADGWDKFANNMDSWWSNVTNKISGWGDRLFKK